MNNDSSEVHIPFKNDTEDKIFSICDVEIEEFTEYITHIKGIQEVLHKRYLSHDYSDLNIDHAYLLENGEIIHIEHHTHITPNLMRRNFQYETALHAATKKLIHPFIFNTGPVPDFSIEYASPTSFYNPTWVNTQQFEQSVKLNNIRYKIENNHKVNVFDVIDIIWMPKYRSNQQTENIIMELIRIYKNIIIDEKLHETLRKCLVLWSGKLLTKENNIKKAIRGLKMSKKEINEIESDIVIARIDGMICRAEQAGMEKGIKEGIEKGIKEGMNEGIEKGIKEGMEKGMNEGKLETARNMMKKGFAVKDIAEITGISEKNILNIK